MEDNRISLKSYRIDLYRVIAVLRLKKIKDVYIAVYPWQGRFYIDRFAMWPTTGIGMTDEYYRTGILED
jgi:hypothetical protein